MLPLLSSKCKLVQAISHKTIFTIIVTHQNNIHIMKFIGLFALLAISIFTLCNFTTDQNETIPASLVGTWQLISATATSKGVTTFTDYTKTQSMIKVINKTHFAFLKHNLNTPKDSTNGFDSGGGAYTLVGNNIPNTLITMPIKNGKAKYFISL